MSEKEKNENLEELNPEEKTVDEKEEAFEKYENSIEKEDVEEENLTKDFYQTAPSEDSKIDFDNLDDVIEEEQRIVKTTVKIDKITLTNQCSIILTKL